MFRLTTLEILLKEIWKKSFILFFKLDDLLIRAI